MTAAAQRRAALEVLVGEWSAQLDVPGAPLASYSFEWALDGTYLVERSSVPHPDVPDSFSVISYDAEADEFLRHYFDVRGVVRLYRMDLAEDVWTLARTEPDFTPLHFAQRFVGTFSSDRNRIDARWEISSDGGTTWDLDFPLTFVRRA